MKISRGKVTAATSNKVSIPEPFNKVYRLMSDEEFEDEIGYDAHPSPCEETEGYDVEFISYACAKDDYMDSLGDDGLDFVELIKENGNLMLAYVVGDRIYPVAKSDLDKALGWDWDDEDIEGSTKVTAAIKTGMNYWYLTKHGLGPGMMPGDVTLIDVVDDGWDTYVLLDKMLTTDELKYFDMKEKWPPENLLKDVKAATAEELQKKFCEYTDKQNKVGKQLDDLQENTKKRSGLFNKKKSTNSSKCTKVAEDKDSIEYIVASEDDEDYDFGIANVSRDKVVSAIEDHFNISDNHAEIIYDWYDNEGAFEDFDSISDFLDYLDDDIINMLDACDDDDLKDEIHSAIFGEEEGEIEGATEVEEETEEDFLDQPDHEFKSDKTAVNGKQGKLPAVFKKANFPNGALVLDYGGGTPESEQVAQAYLDQFDAKEMIYDPFNQTAEHNRNVVKELKANGGADVAVCSNVLNVVKEEAVRIDILNKIKKLLKQGATAYITVYEGSGKDEGAATQNNESFQNNKKLGGYLEEIKTVFPEATKKGSVIVAPNSSSSKPVKSTTDISAIDLDQLRSDIVAGCEKYLTGPKGGFLPSGTPKQDKWDMTADEMYIVEIEEQDGRIKVEVRAELDFDGMMNMGEILDEIIKKYDSDAYFDMEEPGIMDAYIEDNSITSSTVVEGARDYDSWNEQMLRQHDNDLFNPPDYEEEEDPEPTEINFALDFYVKVEENGEWDEDTSRENNNEEADYYNELIKEDQLEEDFIEMLTWDIPSNPGVYHVTGSVNFIYKPEYGYLGNLKYVLDTKHSKINDVQVTPAGYNEEISEEEVESSTNIEAAMTDKDVEYAILNNKPFELDAFKEYWGDKNPNAITAEKVEVGDVIKITSAETVDYGTVVKVLEINGEDADSYFDYTFNCEVIEPANERSSSKVGDQQLLWFDADEEVGEIIPA